MSFWPMRRLNILCIAGYVHTITRFAVARSSLFFGALDMISFIKSINKCTRCRFPCPGDQWSEAGATAERTAARKACWETETLPTAPEGKKLKRCKLLLKVWNWNAANCSWRWETETLPTAPEGEKLKRCQLLLKLGNWNVANCSWRWETKMLPTAPKGEKLKLFQLLLKVRN